MKDEFLTRFREAPSAEFAEALYQRISQPPRPHFDWKVKMANKLTFRNIGAMLAFMLVLAACAYYATTQTPYHKVGGIWLTVQKTRIAEYIPTPEVIEVSDIPFQTDECLSLEEAREIMRFDFLVPTWAPEGFTFNGTLPCGVDSTSDFASLSWKGNDGISYIGIFIRNLKSYNPVTNTYRVGEAAVWEPVAPGSYKEVQVNDQPAVLIRGAWDRPQIVSDPHEDLEAKWDKNLGLHLYWVNGEVLYYLYTCAYPYADLTKTCANVSAEDLIKMAESAR